MIKNIIILLCIVLGLFNNAQAQTINAPFVGTWQWQNGNKIFQETYSSEYLWLETLSDL